MKITKQSRRDAKRLFQCCLVKGKLDEKRALDTVKQVADKKPRGYFGILNHFQRLVQLDVAGRTALVQSAVKLEDRDRKDIQKKLEEIYDGKLNLNFEENKELIGGIRIQIGSDVYDGSVSARLSHLREQF